PTANLVSIVILSRGKCGLSKCITRYLVAMSVSDLILVFTEVILSRIISYHFPNSFLFITPVCRLIFFLFATTTATSVWFTVSFTFDRYVAICCQKLKTKYCTDKTACVVIAVINVLFIGQNIPWYFLLTSVQIVTNIPWGCEINPDFFTSLTWAAFDLLDIILTPIIPFLLIMLLNALTVSHILVASRARSRLWGYSSADRNRGASDSDPEIKNRRKSIVLLFAVSARQLKTHSRLSYAFPGHG
uniref:G-protein coupled receptors family 1 profile domain-containing protein n=1 Tax=Callorhinchus milii TaxID=7868 RepID=A0A4W3GJZ0_CALMI